jgi:hypothetical protein
VNGFSIGFKAGESLTQSYTKTWVYQCFKWGSLLATGFQVWELNQEYSAIHDTESAVRFGYHVTTTVVSVGVEILYGPEVGLTTEIMGIGLEFSYDFSVYSLRRFSYEISNWYQDQVYKSIGIWP